MTHDLDAAARADRVLVVDGGAVVHDGAPGPALAAYRALMATPLPGEVPPGAPASGASAPGEVVTPARGRQSGVTTSSAEDDLA